LIVEAPARESPGLRDSEGKLPLHTHTHTHIHTQAGRQAGTHARTRTRTHAHKIFRYQVVWRGQLPLHPPPPLFSSDNLPLRVAQHATHSRLSLAALIPTHELAHKLLRPLQVVGGLAAADDPREHIHELEAQRRRRVRAALDGGCTEECGMRNKEYGIEYGIGTGIRNRSRNTE